MRWLLFWVCFICVSHTAAAGMSHYRAKKQGPMDQATCEKLKQAFADYAQYGTVAVNQGARDRGVSSAQIRQARAGCRK